MTLEERLEKIDEKIESLLVMLVERQQVREWLTTREFAQATGKSEFTIREYCRRGRLHAKKRQSGRGAHLEYALSRIELERYRRHGLLHARKPDALAEPGT
jgi:hypothetical protein